MQPNFTCSPELTEYAYRDECNNIFMFNRTRDISLKAALDSLVKPRIGKKLKNFTKILGSLGPWEEIFVTWPIIQDKSNVIAMVHQSYTLLFFVMIENNELSTLYVHWMSIFEFHLCLFKTHLLMNVLLCTIWKIWCIKCHFIFIEIQTNLYNRFGHTTAAVRF